MVSLLQRKPDSGLGNIRASPADPRRNVDWVLMLVQGLLTVIGCAVVYSATRTRTAGLVPVPHPPGDLRHRRRAC